MGNIIHHTTVYLVLNLLSVLVDWNSLFFFFFTKAVYNPLGFLSREGQSHCVTNSLTSIPDSAHHPVTTCLVVDTNLHVSIIVIVLLISQCHLYAGNPDENMRPGRFYGMCMFFPPPSPACFSNSIKYVYYMCLCLCVCVSSLKWWRAIQILYSKRPYVEMCILCDLTVFECNTNSTTLIILEL